MVFFLYALVATVAGVIPWLDFDGGKSKVPVLALVVNFIIGLMTGYLLTPFFYGPFMGLTSTIIIFGGVNMLIACFGDAMFDTYGGKTRMTTGGWLYLAAFVVFIITGFAGSKMMRADDYRDLLGSVEDRVWEDDVTPVDLTHIRVVSREQAEWLGNKVIGEAEGSLGSRYEVGEYHIQRVQDELYWVAPLEFRGFFKWLKYDHVVGFVMVSAEDRGRQPELFTGHEMKYMASAFFGDDLTRHLYTNGYAKKGLTEYTFEVDDDLKPYWVITVFHPSITYGGRVVDGVVILDPETGESRFYGVDEVPDWVDRVYPEELVEDYVTWNGKYVQGWVNSWASEENVEVPTPYGNDMNDVFLVWGESDSEPYWFTGITSSSSADQSLTGFMMVNSRTGEARRYRVTGPNEEAVLQAVNNAVSNYEGWHGTQTILYNIGGEKTWLVPVVGSNNILQRIAMVRLSNATVALGSDVRETLRNYRLALASDGFSVAPSEGAHQIAQSGLVLSRMSTENLGGRTVYYLFFDDLPEQVFTATSDISPELPITRVGERVSIRFVETTEAIVQIDLFDNDGLHIRRNDEQVDLDERRVEAEAERQTRDNARDARRVLEGISPEELLELKAIRDSIRGGGGT